MDEKESFRASKLPIDEPLPLALPDEKIVVGPLDLPAQPTPIILGDDVPSLVEPLLLPDEKWDVLDNISTDQNRKASPRPTLLPMTMPIPIQMPEDSISVSPLDLPPDKPHAEPQVSVAFATDENPIVVQAMKRARELHPDKIDQMYLSIRSHLQRILPYSFSTLSEYGSEVLNDSFRVVSDLVNSIQNIEQIRAQESIQKILDSADPAKRKPGFLGFGKASFNLNDAREQLDAIKKALHSKLGDLNLKIAFVQELQHKLTTHVVVMSVLSSMTDHNVDGNLVARKTNLFDTALQELVITLKRMQAMQTQAQEWILRCEEVRNITLPAYGLI